MDLEGQSRRQNLHFLGLEVSVEGGRPTDFLSGLMCKRGHSLLRRTWIEPIAPWQRNQPRQRPRPVITHLHREARRTGKLDYRGQQIHIVEDYCHEVLNQRSEYREVMMRLYNPVLRSSLRQFWQNLFLFNVTVYHVFPPLYCLGAT